MNISIVKTPLHKDNSFYFIKQSDNLKETFAVTENNLYSMFDSDQDPLLTYKKDDDIDSRRVEYTYYMDDNFHTRLFIASISLLGVWVLYEIYTKNR